MDKSVEKYLLGWNVDEKFRELLSRPIGHFIDGQVQGGSDIAHLDVYEPSTGGRLTGVASGGKGEVDLAVSAARREIDGGTWSRLKAIERERLMFRLADLMESHSEELALLESVNVGKNIADSISVDVQGSIDTLRYFAGWATKINGRTGPAVAANVHGYTLKEPVGVVGAIIPWNFPLQTLIWKTSAALAAGCTIVAKPSEITPLTALRFGELAMEAGFPAGVINIVNGTGPSVGAALSSHAGVNKISFTGSTQTGVTVGKAALDDLKRCTLELGGKSPAIVMSNVNIDVAAENVARGLFFNSGQVCDAGSRALVAGPIFDDFVAALVKYVDGLKMGPGLDIESFITPLVSAQHRTRVEGYIQNALKSGAIPLLGGREAPGDGYYVSPQIFQGCEGMEISRDEIFGPVLTVQSFENEAEAIAVANDTQYGLAATIYSSDIDSVNRMVSGLKAGTIYVNAHGTIDPAFPFGGYKKSGFGKDLGPEQLESYLETKTVLVAR
jgi:phenylacetaldehyde dehydrogenase